VQVWVDPSGSYYHDGTWPAAGNIYRRSTASNYVASLVIGDNYVIIKGLAIATTSVDRGRCIGFSGNFANGANLVVISHCVIKGTDNTTDIVAQGGGIFLANASQDYLNTQIFNNIIYDFTSSYADASAAICARQFAGTAKIYANTIHNCDVGVYRSSTCAATLKNNIFAGACTKDAVGTITDTYCSTTNDNTKGLTAAGTGNRFGQTFTFVNELSDNFHLASDDTGAIDFGVDLSADTPAVGDDIDRTARSGIWDIGADEYVPVLLFVGTCMGGDANRMMG
jgi:hypothetical protein